MSCYHLPHKNSSPGFSSEQNPSGDVEAKDISAMQQGGQGWEEGGHLCVCQVGGAGVKGRGEVRQGAREVDFGRAEGIRKFCCLDFTASLVDQSVNFLQH